MKWNKTKIYFVLFGLVGLLIFSEYHNKGVSSVPPPPRHSNQTLFIALDGVPYSMMEKLHKEGGLSSFNSPTRLIATFPSTTTTGFTGLFKSIGAQKSPGYDAKFFSYLQNHVKGNLLEAYDYEAADYNRFFFYNRNTGLQQVVMYTAPSFALKSDLKEIQPYLWEHPEQEALFFYVGATDGTGHLDGPEDTENLVRYTLKEIAALRENYRQAFDQDLQIVLFSDHGFYWDKLKKIDISEVEERLSNMGLKLSEDLKYDNHVVAITWGNISGGDFYTFEKQIPQVASMLIDIEGVDLVNYKIGDKIFVSANRNGIFTLAEVVYSPDGKNFSYRALAGDPLGYLPLQEELKKEGKLNQEGFASEKDWFAKSNAHQYPDALYRLWDAYYGLVQNPATLLISTHENYEFGDELTRFGASLRGGMHGTHGALAIHSSSSFLATTNSSVSLPPVLRYDQALVPFEKPILNTLRRNEEEHKYRQIALPTDFPTPADGGY